MPPDRGWGLNIITATLATGLLNSLWLGQANAFGADFELGASMGYGAGAITTTMSPRPLAPSYRVNRSEGPGAVSIFFGLILDDHFAISAEHSRFLSIGPLSSGYAETGLAGRWYFFGSIPMTSKFKSSESRVTLGGWAPFVGLSMGYATTDIRQENSIFPVVQGSSWVAGARAGLDFSLSQGIGFRPEMSYLVSVTSTAMSSTSFHLGLFTNF